MKNRVIVCGSRNFTDQQVLFDRMDEILQGKTDVEIVSGHAKGADALGEAYARERGFQLTVFPADWARYGKAAGPIRNREMLAYAMQETATVVAFRIEGSKGTGHMIRIAGESDVDVITVEIKDRRAL